MPPCFGCITAHALRCQAQPCRCAGLGGQLQPPPGCQAYRPGKLRHNQWYGPVAQCVLGGGKGVGLVTGLCKDQPGGVEAFKPCWVQLFGNPSLFDPQQICPHLRSYAQRKADGGRAGCFVHTRRSQGEDGMQGQWHEKGINQPGKLMQILTLAGFDPKYRTRRVSFPMPKGKNARLQNCIVHTGVLARLPP